MPRITCKEAPDFFYSELLTQKKDECHDQAKRLALDLARAALAWHGQGVAVGTGRPWPCRGRPWALSIGVVGHRRRRVMAKPSLECFVL